MAWQHTLWPVLAFWLGIIGPLCGCRAPRAADADAPAHDGRRLSQPTSSAFATAGASDVDRQPLQFLSAAADGTVRPAGERAQSRYGEELLGRFDVRDRPDEVFALEARNFWGGDREVLEVAVRADGAELRFYRPERPDHYFVRRLTAAELASFRTFVAERRPDDLPMLDQGALDGTEYYYYHVTPTYARQVTINNPGAERSADDPDDPGSGVYSELVRLFRNLYDPDEVRVRYRWPQGPPEDVEVLYAHPDRQVFAVWAEGEDVRALVDADDDYVHIFKWRSLVDGRLGPEVDAPTAIAPGSYADTPWHLNSPQPWRVWYDGGEVREATTPGADGHGTWLWHDGKPVEKLTDLAFRHHLVTADGRWLVGGVRGELTLFDLQNRRAVDIENKELAEGYFALADLPSRGSVLLVRHETTPFGPVPDGARFMLLDLARARVDSVQSAADVPWLQELRRPLQPTRDADLVWVARPSGDVGTSVARYDTRKLELRDWANGAPLLRFQSDAMWVDETAGRIYAVHGVHVFRFPLDVEIPEDRDAE